MKILHIHQDYPDGRAYPFTNAVVNLIASCEQKDTTITHSVLSINRTSNPFKVSVKPFEKGVSIVYWAIPLPFIYYYSMKLSAAYLFKYINLCDIDIIHGHKSTTEGVFAYWLAKKINKPYVLSVRGGSDMHNVQRRVLSQAFLVNIFKQATKVFWVSAWAKKPMQKLLSRNAYYSELNTQLDGTNALDLLPNICHINLAFPHKPASQRKGYITAVSYHQYKRKGLAELIASIASLQCQIPDIELNIYGSGDAIYQEEIEALIIEFNAQNFIHLKGQVSHDKLLLAMSESKGFLLPAVNETFGMAYIEALSVGCPILYVENTGIDGYFEQVYVGEKITSLNVEELTQSIQKLDRHNAQLCQKIKTLQEEQTLSMFTSSPIATEYTNDLREVLHG